MKRLLFALTVVVILPMALSCYSAPVTSPRPTEPPATTPSLTTSPASPSPTPAPTYTPAQSPSPTIIPTLSPSPTPSPSPTAAGVKAGEFAEAGKAVFASRCAGCHGAQGQGGLAPAVIGANARLDKFNTAKGLFDYESKTMPANSPGSLSQQEYLQILGLLLVQNSYVTEEMPIDAEKLDVILLKK